MSKAIVIQITVYDDDTNQVSEQFIEHYDGSFGYEVRNLFDRLGVNIALKVDPQYEP